MQDCNDSLGLIQSLNLPFHISEYFSLREKADCLWGDTTSFLLVVDWDMETDSCRTKERQKQRMKRQEEERGFCQSRALAVHPCSLVIWLTYPLYNLSNQATQQFSVNRLVSCCFIYASCLFLFLSHCFYSLSLHHHLQTHVHTLQNVFHRVQPDLFYHMPMCWLVLGAVFHFSGMFLKRNWNFNSTLLLCM